MNPDSIASFIQYPDASNYILAQFVAVRDCRIIPAIPDKIVVVVDGKHIPEAVSKAADPDSNSIIYYRFKDSNANLLAMLIDGKHYAVTKFGFDEGSLVLEGAFDTYDQGLTDAVLAALGSAP